MDDMNSLSIQALEANETHKNALDAYTSKLQAELLTVDKLIAAVEQLPEDENQEGPSDKWCLQVEKAFKPSGIIDLTQARNEFSPFYPESIRKDRYLLATTPNPFNKSEIRYLEKAVVKENKRLAALRAQQSGLDPFKVATVGNDFFLHNIDDIDWASVARDVSASNSPLGSRTAQDCKVRWLGAQHPKINNDPWSSVEEGHLRKLVESKRGSRIDWEEISRILATNRTPLDCIKKYQRGTRPTFKWTEALDKKLMDAVQEHGNSNWGQVATLVSSDVSANQCQIRYGRSINPDIKRGKFSQEEDQLLKKAVDTHGYDWVKVSESLPGRINAQCREHYMQHFAKPVQWTEEEDAMLKNAVKRLGHNWKQVCEEMGGVKPHTQYASRYRLLARTDTQEANAKPAAGAASVAISGEPNDELRPAEVVPVLMGTRRGPIRSTRANTANSIQKTMASKGKGVSPGTSKGLNFLPDREATTPKDESSSTSIRKKRPRPRPSFRGAADASSTVPSLTGASAPAPSQATAQAVASTSAVSRTPSKQILESAAASLTGELSDLTDLEDLEEMPPPKKKARGSVQNLKPVTPARTSKPRTSLASAPKPSPQKPKPSPSQYTLRTRSSVRNAARGR